jgi:hypothetical protein
LGDDLSKFADELEAVDSVFIIFSTQPHRDYIYIIVKAPAVGEWVVYIDAGKFRLSLNLIRFSAAIISSFLFPSSHPSHSGKGSGKKRLREWIRFEINVLMGPWILQI